MVFLDAKTEGTGKITEKALQYTGVSVEDAKSGVTPLHLAAQMGTTR